MTTSPVQGPVSHFFTSQRLRLHYVDWGNPEKPPLLLVHGGRDHCRNWDWVAERLRHDWHVIAPDLRGHGDSQWSPDGAYLMPAFIYDLAQLVHHLEFDQVSIVAHSLGGNIALRYAGLYPEMIRRLVAIEGLGPSPKMLAERAELHIAERMRNWIEQQRGLAARTPRRYPTVEDALARMQEENSHLAPDQARHLTRHGLRRNEDGTYSWKFDNYIRSWPPVDLPQHEIAALWARISAPTLLVYGSESWASNPTEDGRVRHFRNATVASVEGAGHWVQHDQLDAFMQLLRGFL